MVNLMMETRVSLGALCLLLRLDPAMVNLHCFMVWNGCRLSDIKNPAVSSLYRSSKLPKPNQTVLEAQARVCSGPTRTRPLNEEQASKVLDTILRSGEFTIFTIC